MDDVNPALRAELTAAADVLDPQIRGLHDLANVSISPELADHIAAQLAVRERRRGLIKGVLDALDQVLEAMQLLADDGYPDLLKESLSRALEDELRGEESDIDAAVAVFEAALPASRLVVDLGVPVEKDVSLT